MFHDPTAREVQDLYRSVAIGEPREVVLEMIYDLFGDTGELRPPLDEMRLADRVSGTKDAAHG